MTAAPLFLSPVSTSHARGHRLTYPAGLRPRRLQGASLPATGRQSRVTSHSTATAPQANVRVAKAPASWQLTDRGIAVIMVIAGVIMTIALVVVGLTALRVTSADYEAGLPTSLQAQALKVQLGAGVASPDILSHLVDAHNGG